MKSLILAALAVTASSLVFGTEAANAQAVQQQAQQNGEASLEVDPRSVRRGKPGRVYWNVADVPTMASLLRQGGQVCEGSVMQGTCITFSRMLGELTITNIGRQIAGLGANFHSFRVIRATAQGAAIFDERGNYVTLVADVAKAENAAARWTTGLAAVPAAFVNGGLSSLVNATIGNCCGGGGPSAMAVSMSDAAAQNIADVLVQQGASGVCGTSGPCYKPTPLQPGHTQD